MAALAPTPAAFAVSLGASDGGSLTYTLAQGLVWRLLALSFTVDLSASAFADDVFVRLLNEAGALIVGEVPGSGQTAGTSVTYSLSPHLNPCDGITSGFVNLAPDTFPAVTLTGGCQVVIDARVTSTGAPDTDAAITGATAWMEDAGGGGPSLAPLLVPAPLSLSGITSVGAGG